MRVEKRSTRMPGRVLLDTNVVIALFASEKAVIERVAQTQVLASSTVLGELYYGAMKSGRPSSNLSRIDEFAASFGVREGGDKECSAGPVVRPFGNSTSFPFPFQAGNPAIRKEMEKAVPINRDATFLYGCPPASVR